MLFGVFSCFYLIKSPRFFWGYAAGRDVTNFEFAFNNMRILTTFQLFDIQRIVGGTSVEYFR